MCWVFLRWYNHKIEFYVDVVGAFQKYQTIQWQENYFGGHFGKENAPYSINCTPKQMQALKSS